MASYLEKPRNYWGNLILLALYKCQELKTLTLMPQLSQLLAQKIICSSPCQLKFQKNQVSKRRSPPNRKQWNHFALTSSTNLVLLPTNQVGKIPSSHTSAIEYYLMTNSKHVTCNLSPLIIFFKITNSTNEVSPFPTQFAQMKAKLIMFSSKYMKESAETILVAEPQDIENFAKDITG